MVTHNSAFSEETLHQFVRKQLRFNSGKNIFYSGEENKPEFLQETCDLIEILQKNLFPEREKMIEFTVDKVLSEFYKVNQYYHFDKNAQSELKQVYRDLLDDITSVSKETDIAAMAEKHYSRLQQWLQRTNPFAASLYPEDVSVVDEVVCAEYSAEMQMEILGLNLSTMVGPVLDVGCGAKAQLVTHLTKAGFDASGIDRNAEPGANLKKTDWMDFSFVPGHWGTIISNLGFSNHFRHHHLRNDGDYLDYARKYMEILQSLKPGGAFYYAPDLPFIESYLDPQKYRITKREIPRTGFFSVKIEFIII
ncbi:MAG: hypothetical protein A2W90_20500 [Bacteroidetes bacterium GWF2_42_66]|nr:MAG: hypothetical protein A2W92_06365 [Bacteroidetes bacterium GWA2_42_15]OFX98491.1 MAG: hypothetical protein A2W89_08865 [Bacteroidetes bacterium GWE2_42_39]OFY42876.1 MAG: hypothetical protein A2W90_20500 [Bacteroidetes bacterium GWF2_42_66]HBL75327.1 class I SAM-dependent methyltransferase [Prolixibacteraceae bacterium]HCR91480.1 class I SAM-dependent methyltransferase [Prolixibacteraceae bacterium]